MHLTLLVKRLTWSPSAAPGAESGTTNGAPNTTAAATATVEISGQVAEENLHVKLGAFHTLDIEANKDVRIEKEAGGWDSVALGRVEESCVPGRGAEVAAIVCGEGAFPFIVPSLYRAQDHGYPRHGHLLPTIAAYDRRSTTTRSAHSAQNFEPILRS